MLKKLSWKRIFGLIAVVIIVDLIWNYFNPRPSNELECYLDNKICMDILLWNGFGNYNNSDKNLYFSNHSLSEEKQVDFRNEHGIHVHKLFDYLKDCKELNSSSLICAYQSAIPFKGKTCKQVIKETNSSGNWNLFTRVPIEQWELRFFTLQVLDFDQFAYKVKELKEVDFKREDKSILKWKNSHSINPQQRIRCISEDEPLPSS